jgi:hypothetical protein
MSTGYKVRMVILSILQLEYSTILGGEFFWGRQGVLFQTREIRGGKEYFFRLGKFGGKEYFFRLGNFARGGRGWGGVESWVETHVDRLLYFTNYCIPNWGGG